MYFVWVNMLFYGVVFVYKLMDVCYFVKFDTICFIKTAKFDFSSPIIKAIT